ncbi:MAG: SUMF1/EgtB/PvdO family nonheme iron enzyme [Clostridia bacterium]|nr:SUMF1/EgtB/PvdO family nonheme iron enzyme [Clostridia bacterium]
MLGIYDLAGNVWEWTLEKTLDTSRPSANRGGCYYYTGSERHVFYRNNVSTSYTSYNYGFRVVLW